jgi:hypothetical protein
VWLVCAAISHDWATICVNPTLAKPEPNGSRKAAKAQRRAKQVDVFLRGFAALREIFAVCSNFS